MSHFSRYWRGDLPFWAVLSIVLGSSFISFLLFRGLAAAFIVPVTALLTGVTILQVAGTHRFSDRMLRDGWLLPAIGAYFALLVAVIMNVNLFIGVRLPEPEMSLEIHGWEPKLRIEGEIGYIEGEITYQVLTELKTAKQVKELVFSSSGGLAQAGHAVGLYVRENGIATRVEQDCFSACTLAFAGGTKRTLGLDGHLGFHGYRFDHNMRVQTLDMQDVVVKHRAE